MSPPRILAACLLPALAASCAHAPKPAEVDANGKKIEYVYYTPTGSSIPVRVRRDEMQAPDSQTASDQRALSNLQRESVADSSPSPGPGGR
jgi:hypothetical protein